MNIVIVDDVPGEVEPLKAAILEYGTVNGMTFDLEEFRSGEKLLESYEPFRYGVIFLDIYMGELTGIETAKRIRERDLDVPIVFLTSSMEHMGSAFSIHAYDYIEKPGDKERIFHVLDDLLRTETRTQEATIAFSSERKDYVLPISDIVSITTSVTNYLDILDKRGVKYHPRLTFSYVCEVLEEVPQFLLIHRGVLINMDYVEEFSDGTCYMINKDYYPVFSKKAEELEKTWQNYYFSRVRNRQKKKRRKTGKQEK